MREFVTRLLRRAPLIKPLWDEFERMLAARDAAIAERDAAVAVRDNAVAERDAALAARSPDRPEDISFALPRTNGPIMPPERHRPAQDQDLGMLKLDIGCGAYGRAGFIGIDIVDGADIRCDVTRERLPFEDSSAGHIFSSHCLEHIASESLPAVVKEMIRVAANGALIEIWHPLAFHNDAYVAGHRSFLTETQYRHFCMENWLDFFESSLVLEEIRYHLSAQTLEKLQKQQLDIDFAICHLNNIVHEIGIYLRVGKPRGCLVQGSVPRVVCSGGDGLSWLNERDNCIIALPPV